MIRKTRLLVVSDLLISTHLLHSLNSTTTMSTTTNTESHLSSTKMESAQGSKGQTEGTALSGSSAQLDTTKERAAETDLLVYDV